MDGFDVSAEGDVAGELVQFSADRHRRGVGPCVGQFFSADHPRLAIVFRIALFPRERRGRTHRRQCDGARNTQTAQKYTPSQ
jgi:hypothetical protein